MKNTTKHAEMYAKITAHGESLCKIFNLDKDPVKLSKALFSLENKAHRITTLECNTGQDFAPELARIRMKVLEKLELKEADPLAKAIFINGDPRGYALKINDKAAKNLTIYKDMGGYGILAPDFN